MLDGPSVSRAVDLGAIASGDDQRLADRRQRRKLAQRLGHARRLEYHALAHLHGCGAVIDADDDKGHLVSGEGNREILGDGQWQHKRSSASAIVGRPCGNP
jgi:hypothetical protein